MVLRKWCILPAWSVAMSYAAVADIRWWTLSRGSETMAVHMARA